MGAPVWGTFSVRDHIRQEAFVRDVLLFDRLAIPYPDPRLPEERDRWQSQGWDPERLDQVLRIIGTETDSGHAGARLAQRVPWSPALWTDMTSRLETAGRLTGNPYWNTPLGLVHGRYEIPQIPNAVEAVAAYPGEAEWRRDVEPVAEPPRGDIDAAEALVRLSRPLLLPERVGDDDLYTLQRAVELAVDEDYRALRSAYHDWFRNYVERLRRAKEDLIDVMLDPATVQLAEERLRELWDNEQKLVLRKKRLQNWKRVEVGAVTVSTLGAIGLALMQALPGVGVGAAALTWVGWAASKRQSPPAERSLGGAAVFVEAQQRLGGWHLRID